jgi:carboxyl-terminal processing protease
MTRFRCAGVVTLLLLASGCGSNSGTSPSAVASSSTACPVTTENSQILTTMQSWYYWYTALPANVSPSAYSTPSAFLDAIRYQPLDHFSFIMSQTESQAYFGAGQYVGFGFGVRLSADNASLEVTQVFPGSPAAGAALERGYRVTAIDGVAVSSLVASNQLNAALSGGTAGVSRTLTVRDRQQQTRTVTMTSAVVTEPSVGGTAVLDAGRERVGYVLFNSFVGTSNAALDKAFADFAAAGVTQVVIDERYNGGGDVSVAQHLATLIAGNAYAGKTFVTLTYNDKHAGTNQALTFPSVAGAMSLPQVVFITTRSSASASELMINGLDPYIRVATVGATTYGKPVGMNGFNICADVLYPITFSIKNINGYGEYFDGLPPTCAAADDVDYLLGDPAEPSLSTALEYIRTGRCGARATAEARAQSAREASRPRLDWRSPFHQIVDAY